MLQKERSRRWSRLKTDRSTLSVVSKSISCVTPSERIASMWSWSIHFFKTVVVSLVRIASRK